MFFALTKFCALFLYPLGFSLLLGTLGLGLILCYRRRGGILCIALSLSVLGICSWPPFSHILIRSLESKYSQLSHYPRCGAIVLLGGSEVPALKPRLYPEINEAGDRIIHASRLFNLGYAPYIIASGGKIPFIKEFNGSEAKAAFDILCGPLHIPPSKVIVDTLARSTYENINNLKKILAEKNISDTLILVTSALHMKRAMSLVCKAGMVAFAAPTDFRAEEHFQWKLYNLLPQTGTLYSTTAAIHEYYGLFWYKLLKRI